MGDLEDRTKRNTNATGEGRQIDSDPIVQARDDSGRPHKGVPSAEVVRTVRTIPVAERTLPNQFMQTAGPAQTGLSVNDIAASMWRYKWMIIAIFILVAAPAIAAIWTQIVPQYQARAELRISPIIPRLVFRTEDNGMIPLYQSFANTQVSIMRSPRVLNRVLEQRELQQTQWYKGPQRSLMQRLLGNQAAPPLERLRDNLSVRPRRGTEIIDVSFVAPSAKEAKLIVDTVLDQYKQYVGESSDASEDQLFDQLVQQHKSLEQDIEGLETTTTGFSESLGTTAPDSLISAKRARLEQTEERLRELAQIITDVRYQIEEANAVDSNEAVGEIAERIQKQQRHSEDAEWRKLELQVRTIEHQIANSILTPKHPQMDRMKKDLEFAEESLRRREAQLDEQWADQVADAAGPPATDTGSGNLGTAGLSITVAGSSGIDATGLPMALAGVANLSGEEKLAFLKRQLGRAEQLRDFWQNDLDTQKEAFEDFCTKARLLAKENRRLQYKTELFTAVRQRLDEKTMERQVSVGGSIEVLTRALVGSEPYNDRRVVFTAMALVMGLGLGGGAAFLRASRNQTIHAPRDMPAALQAPFLGYVPLTRIRRPMGKSLQDEIRRIRHQKIESIRLVRTALLSRLNGRGGTTMLISSAAEGTGKSTFTMMLGKSLAQSGKTVIMVDADLQKMTLTKRFGLADEPGFMESLRSKSVDKRHIFATETSGLSILAAGRPNGDGAVFEGTSNGAFKACIDQLRRRFDIVLLDSSPILAAADATILSGQVDGTIMVERELVSQRRNVIDAIARLDSAGGQLMGTVFVGSGKGEDYGYSYGYA